MFELLNALPERLVDDFIAHALNVSPSLRHVFLASLGSSIHVSTVRVLFGTLNIPDDCRIFESSRSVLVPILSNPDKYAHAVKSLVIRDPSLIDTPLDSRFGVENLKGRITNGFCPMDASQISGLLKVCYNLEEIIWESSTPPPDGLCEMLAASTARLTQFAYTPNSRTKYTLSRSKWSCPSLPLLVSLPLTSLRLTRLSQAGSRALSTLLSSLSEYSSLDHLSIDFIFLDDQLCERIVEAGRRLRCLKIGTSGTKLTDKGICILLEGCDSLEELFLEDVQGRLGRSLWTRPVQYPPGLKRFKVAVSEVGPHHSWTTDHLSSLHAIPLQSLEELSVVRREASPRLQGDTTLSYDLSPLEDVVALKPVPGEFVKAMKEAERLRKFECDWWTWSISDLKTVLESCPKLETIRLCLDAPFSKLLNLTSPFASLTSLQQIFVSITPSHAPGKPPALLLPASIEPSLPTPTDSPVLKAKTALPQLLDFDQMQTQTRACVMNESVSGDNTLPLTRDIKRFVRKCPKLTVLDWYGKAGRGRWYITRQATTSKATASVSIQYIPPTISEDTWKALRQERDTIEGANVERVGQTWTGDAAEAFALEMEREKEEHVPPVGEKEKENRQGRPRKAKTPSISTSGASGCGSDVSPTSSYFSHSPVRSYTLPLTPPNSGGSLSNSMMLGGVAESLGSESPVHDNFRDLATLGRKRAPSEPGLRSTPLTNGRIRSVTAPSKEKVNADGDKTSVHSGSNGMSPSSGFKSGRGRGGRGGSGGGGERRDAKKRTPGSANGTRGRGANHSVSFGNSRGRKTTSL